MASLIRYLEQAARTALGMWNVSRWYSQMGLMVGSVYLEVCCASASVRGAPDGLLMTTDRRSDCASLIRCCAIWSAKGIPSHHRCARSCSIGRPSTDDL